MIITNRYSKKNIPSRFTGQGQEGVSRCLAGAGVTLIELIVVITITGIVAGMLGTFIIRPMQSYEAQARRAQLVDAAEMSLRRMSRDIRRALPNSVRVDATGRVIEMLNTMDGARYREDPGTFGGHNHSNLNYRLTFTGADTTGFNVMGHFRNIENDFTLPTTTTPFTSNNERLAVYSHTASSTYTDAAATTGPRVITNPSTTKFTIVVDDHANNDGFDEHRVVPFIGNNFYFLSGSPSHRVYIVDTPITYLCAPGATGTIMRYTNYAITAAQPTNPTAAPLLGVTPALLTTPVTTCNFSYTGGTPQRAGLVTLDIAVSDTASGDVVRLLYQVHVDNSP